MPDPKLAHTLHQEQSSVLSLAASDQHIFSGSQGTDIYVWDRRTLTAETTLKGHSGSVLALEVAKEKDWLFSSSGDSTVRIWSTKTLTPLYVLTPHLDTDAGDIFSLTYSSSLNTIFFGCQNTSLQWFEMDRTICKEGDRKDDQEGEEMAKKRHKFFDSLPRSASGASTPQVQPAPPAPSNLLTLHPTSVPPPTINTDRPCTPCSQTSQTEHARNGKHYQVPSSNNFPSAHFGYIYCMALVPPHADHKPHHAEEAGTVELVTGSGDEEVKLWQITPQPKLLHTFAPHQGGVLSVVVSSTGLVFAGSQDGQIKVWDLETRTLVRTLVAQENVDVLSLSVLGAEVYACSANGYVQRFSSSFHCTSSWPAHPKGIVLSSIIAPDIDADPRHHSHKGKERWSLITGASDNDIKLWNVEAPDNHHREYFSSTTSNGSDPGCVRDTLLHALSKFVSIPSISNASHSSGKTATTEPYVHQEDCRQSAVWLRKCLTQLGAEATLLPSSVQGINPLVLGTFRGAQTDKPKPRILFYGHYDVTPAPTTNWNTPPFTLTSLNGYLYGRGVTDNKGPILAVACAASELLARRELDLDLVVLVEGEEEAGSEGFVDGVRKYKDMIGHVDAILVSNSYWIGDDTPCITYGLRGVVHATIEICNERPDLHSGVEGGAVREPMIDMIKLLATLSDSSSRVQIPGFYDKVRPISIEEQNLLDLLSKITGKPVESLASRWREPSLSIHNVGGSGSENATVIPAHVRAQLSLRIVPDQSVESIASSLKEHIEKCFESYHSPNSLTVSINRIADWWLGKLDDPWFRALEGAVKDEWGVQPLRIREGGSIPSVPFLEKEFKCHALHLPMGQSSDQAHLSNERISLNNLRKGKSVVERFFQAVTGPDFPLLTSTS